MKYISTILTVILFVVFVVSVCQKISNLSSFNNTLISTDLFDIHYVQYFSTGIIILEIITCYFLLYKNYYGWLASLILLILYTGYIAIIKLYYIYPMCGCGGIIAQLPFKTHLLTNLTLIFFISFVLYYKRKDYKWIKFSF